MIRNTTWNVSNPFASLNKFAEIRGHILSHFIGACFVFSFMFDRIIPGEIYYTRFVEIPIRLVAVWLIIDRVGRRGRIQICLWDYLHLGFAGIYGLALVYADLYMQRDSGLQNYISWVASSFSPYFYFLIVREGTLRRGFRPYVVMLWAVSAVFVACLLALAQALNVLGLRHTIDTIVHQRQAEATMEGVSMPWQARGIFVHANNMAIIIIMGIAMLVGCGNYKRFGVYEWICGVTFIATLFATYSRTGIVTAVVMALALIGLMFIQRKAKLAFMSLFALGALVFAFMSAVYILDIKRYQVFVKGEGVVKKESERGLYGWYNRREVLEKAVDTAMKYPFTGVKIATSAINQSNIIQRSTYTFEGLILNVYGFAFVSYGLIGLLYLGGALFALTIPQFKYFRSKYAFPVGAAMCGLAIMITGISENTLFSPLHMTMVNIVMAFAVQKVVRKTEEPSKLMEFFGGAKAVA
ncbi:MAG: O-antigen ligase family protein [Fimbriimonadaceae bacterium]